MSLHFVEVPKFAKLKKPYNELTKMERWMCYFSNSLSVTEKRKIVMHDPAIVSAMNAAGTFFQSDAERRRYIDRELIRMDRESERSACREEGREEGLVQGREEGFVEGRKEEREDLVFGALQRHKNVSDVAAFLGLSEAYVQRVATSRGLLV